MNKALSRSSPADIATSGKALPELDVCRLPFSGAAKERKVGL